MASDVRRLIGARRHSALARALTLAVAVAACGGPGPGPSSAPSAAGAPTPAPTASTPVGLESLDGVWVGDLRDSTNAYPIRLVLDGCLQPEAACGELEYADPGFPDSVLCASELTFTGAESGAFAFSERLVYHPWMCLTTEFRIRATGSAKIEIDQVIGGDVCCSGTLVRSEGAVSNPELPVVEGLGRTTARIHLGGATTQYGAFAAGSLWLPIEDAGAVARVDAATGALSAWIVTGDVNLADGPPAGPHSVVAGDAGIWAPLAGSRSVGRIDPATNEVVETIDIGVVAYSLALEGDTLWVASFEADAVIPVDLKTGMIGEVIAVAKPTGIAVGLGAVWVVRHREDSVVRIDAKSRSIVASISLGDRGPSDVCGMCVENIIVAEGAIWTANNHGRSIGRIDPKTNQATSIAVPLRVWAVAAGNGAVWGSQYDGSADDQFVGLARWGLGRIDPATSASTMFGYEGALAVATSADALWVVIPGRRGDDLARIALEP